MKDKVKAVFEDIHMSKDCEEKILRAAAMPAKKQRPVLRPVLAGAAVLVLVLTLSPTVRAAVGMLFPELGLDIQTDRPWFGGYSVTISSELMDRPPFAEIREGRLYFTGHGQNLDITDQVQNDQPFLYTYQDGEYTLCLAVGIHGSLETYGTYVVAQRGDEPWSAGSGYNCMDPETGQPYPWLGVVMEELNLPWPMPGQ